MKNKVNIKNIVEFYLKKYLWIVIFLFTAIVLYILNEKYFQRFKLPDFNEEIVSIVLALVPMIFTIISISLSLPSDRIYGISRIKFMKIRKKQYSFFEMIIISIISFIVLAISLLIKCKIMIISCIIFSFIISFIFIYQQIPILMNNDNKNKKTLFEYWLYYSENEFEINKGVESCFVICNKALRYLLITEGIDNITEELLKFSKNKSRENKENYLYSLVNLNRELLSDINENIELYSFIKKDVYDYIPIELIVKMSLNNLQSIPSLFEKYDYNGDLINSKYSIVCNCIFCLKNISEKLNLINLFNREIHSFLRLLLIKIDHSKKDNCFEFGSKLICSMLIWTISNDEIWFLQIIRDSKFNNKLFFNEKNIFFLFISIYLFSLSIDKKVYSSTKLLIANFLSENSKGLNSDGSTWNDVFNNFVWYHNFDFLKSLPKLFKIYDINNSNGFLNWFQPEKQLMFTIDDESFSKRIIIRSVLELMILNYHYNHIDQAALIKIIDTFSEEDKREIKEEFSALFDSNDNYKPFQLDKSILNFYKSELIKLNNQEILFKKELINNIKQIKNNLEYDDINNELNRKHVDESKISEYKQKIINIFREVTNNIGISIGENNVKVKKRFTFLFDVRLDYNSDDVLKDITNKTINNFVNETLKNDSKIKLIKNINEIDYSKFKYRCGYLLKNKRCKEEEIINSLKEIKFMFSDVLLLKNKSDLIFKFQVDENNTNIRYLNDNEINRIIDSSFEIVNGLYRYKDAIKSNNYIFLNKNDMFKLLSKKYLIFDVVFETSHIINYKNIIMIKGN